MILTIQVTVLIGSKTCALELKLCHVITTDMHVGIFPFKEYVTIVIGIWNWKKAVVTKLYRTSSSLGVVSTKLYCLGLESIVTIVCPWDVLKSFAATQRKRVKWYGDFQQTCLMAVSFHLLGTIWKYGRSCPHPPNPHKTLSNIPPSRLINRIIVCNIWNLQLPNFKWHFWVSWGKLRRSITQDAVNDTLKNNTLKFVKTTTAACAILYLNTMLFSSH